MGTVSSDEMQELNEMCLPVRRCLSVFLRQSKCKPGSRLGQVVTSRKYGKPGQQIGLWIIYRIALKESGLDQATRIVLRIYEIPLIEIGQTADSRPWITEKNVIMLIAHTSTVSQFVVIFFHATPSSEVA